jgi:oligopeptide transport system permease protein
MSDMNSSSAAEAPGVVGTVGESISPATVGRGPSERPRSLAGDAWRDLRRNPVFLIAAVLLVVLTLMAIVPGLFTTKSPTDPQFCDLHLSQQKPHDGAIFGTDLQGCDVYTLTIYGARASILVGLLSALVSLFVGSTVGLIAGYYGGWLDALVSRVTDVFFAIPLLLGAILVLTAFPNGENGSFFGSITKVTLALAGLGWTVTARVMRAAAIQVRHADYVEAARALGARNGRVILRHVLPNAIAPGIVVSTIALGGYIGAEATLSYLNVGLQPPAVSWGLAISDAQEYILSSPHMLLFPGIFLSVTVLTFIMLGDAVRDALDPKLR